MGFRWAETMDFPIEASCPFDTNAHQSGIASENYPVIAQRIWGCRLGKVFQDGLGCLSIFLGAFPQLEGELGILLKIYHCIQDLVDN